MKKIAVAFDISPLSSGHKIRGIGVYTNHLFQLLQDHQSSDFAIEPVEGISQVSKNFDLVHMPYFDPFFIQLRLSLLKKTVVTIHDLTPILLPDLFPAGVKGNLRWGLNKILLRQVAGIVVPTKKIKEDVVQLVGVSENKVQVTSEDYGEQYHHIEDKKRIASVKKKYHLPESFILYLGDVTPNKNLPRLVRAAMNANLPLVMVGKSITETNFDRTNAWNNDRVYVQSFAKQHKNIYFTGYIPDADLALLFNGATAVAMVSLYEGFGLPIVQAMASGTPVVVSKEGSFPEIVEDAGIYVDAYSDQSIAYGLKKVWGDASLRKKLITKGYIQAKKFNKENVARLTIHAYETFINKK